MDYYRDLSLDEHLANQPGGRLPECQALVLMQPILYGLRAVHAQGFLHRDIKHANIYLAKTDVGGVRPIRLTSAPLARRWASAVAPLMSAGAR